MYGQPMKFKFDKAKLICRLEGVVKRLDSMKEEISPDKPDSLLPIGRGRYYRSSLRRGLGVAEVLLRILPLTEDKAFTISEDHPIYFLLAEVNDDGTDRS